MLFLIMLHKILWNCLIGILYLVCEIYFWVCRRKIEIKRILEIIHLSFFYMLKIRYYSVYDKKMKEIAEQGFPEIIFKKGQFCENFDF